jgi:hypothetical protein
LFLEIIDRREPFLSSFLLGNASKSLLELFLDGYVRDWLRVSSSYSHSFSDFVDSASGLAFHCAPGLGLFTLQYLLKQRFLEQHACQFSNDHDLSLPQRGSAPNSRRNRTFLSLLSITLINEIKNTPEFGFLQARRPEFHGLFDNTSL